MIILKIRPLRIDENHDREYYQVVEGQHKGLKLCKSLNSFDAESGYMTCSKDGEPDTPISKEIEIIII